MKCTKRNQPYRKILPLLLIFITIWISIQIIMTYHFGWHNFKKSFTKAVANRDVVLFQNVNAIAPMEKTILVSTNHHTVVFEIQNIETLSGQETIKWSSHYSWNQFNAEKVTRTIINY